MSKTAASPTSLETRESPKSITLGFIWQIKE